MHFPILLLLALLGFLPANGQRYDIAYQDSIPFPKEKNYFADRQHHRFWVRTDSGWQRLKISSVNGAYEWESCIMVKTGDMRALVSADGKLMFGPSHYIRKHGDLYLGYVCGRGTFLQSLAGDTLAFIPGGEDKKLRGSTETIRGNSALCMPRYLPGLKKMRRKNLRNWGMIDGKGTWLIPPQYDQEFTFENGTARVLSKGRELWIDEQGNEVMAPGAGQ